MSWNTSLMSMYFHVLDPILTCADADVLSYCWCFWAARHLDVTCVVSNVDVVAFTLRELYTSSNFMKGDPANACRDVVVARLNVLMHSLYAAPGCLVQPDPEPPSQLPETQPLPKPEPKTRTKTKPKTETETDTDTDNDAMAIIPASAVSSRCGGFPCDKLTWAACSKLLQAKRDTSLALTPSDVAWLIHLCDEHYTGTLPPGGVTSVRSDGKFLYARCGTSDTRLAISKFIKSVR